LVWVRRGEKKLLCLSGRTKITPSRHERHRRQKKALLHITVDRHQ
jgi:hypothetical protein